MMLIKNSVESKALANRISCYKARLTPKPTKQCRNSKIIHSIISASRRFTYRDKISWRQVPPKAVRSGIVDMYHVCYIRRSLTMYCAFDRKEPHEPYPV